MTIVAGWENPLILLQREIVQLEDEGYVVPESVKEIIAGLHPVFDAYCEEKLSRLHGELEHLPRSRDFRYVQPNDLETIRKERPDGPRQLPLKLSDKALVDRFHGAWTGRASGCALGKPVELIGGPNGENGRLTIKTYLQNRGQWKLDDYFRWVEKNDGIRLGSEKSWRDNIAFMEPDDDIHYTLIGLKVLETKGPGFLWSDVADCWNSSLPYNAVCTAETQAILNYNMFKPRMVCPPIPDGPAAFHPVTAAFTRRHNNPFREWIGAQIRADGWAYACAGNPELAAEFAWRDASWTHTANGIYGEMFFAAIIAAAFVVNDPRKLVEIGLSEIPRNCRLAYAVRQALIWIPKCRTFEQFMAKLESKYAAMSPVHTINNALIVVMSLFYGKMNPDRSICVSVMGGLDTDCNGATTGSIVGVVCGRKRFGGKLASPLNDTIKPLVMGFQTITMKELAERTLAVHKKVCAYSCRRP